MKNWKIWITESGLIATCKKKGRNEIKKRLKGLKEESSNSKMKHKLSNQSQTRLNLCHFKNIKEADLPPKFQEKAWNLINLSNLLVLNCQVRKAWVLKVLKTERKRQKKLPHLCQQLLLLALIDLNKEKKKTLYLKLQEVLVQACQTNNIHRCLWEMQGLRLYKERLKIHLKDILSQFKIFKIEPYQRGNKNH